MVFLLACSVLLSPNSVARLGVLAVSQVVSSFIELPLVSNHTWVLAIANLTLLASMAIARSTGGPLAATTYEIAAPVLRLELVLLYAMAAFHKLNADWFDPAVSCGAVLHEIIAGWFPWDLPQWTTTVSIFVGVGTEIALVFLLAVRRTRPLGIAIGIVFHLVLGTIRFYRFSSQMYALYFLFVPVEYIERGVELWQRARAGWLRPILDHPWASPVHLRRAAWGALGLLTFGVWIVSPWRETSTMDILVRDLATGVRQPRLSQAFHVLWFVGTVALLAIFVRVAVPLRRRVHGEGFRPARVWLLLFPAALLLNGVSPYFGFKTESSFAMFSNLRTTSPGPNHLLVTPLPLLDYGNDLVRIESSSDRQLQTLADTNYLLPWFELTSYLEYQLERSEDVSLTYWRGGVRSAVPSLREASGDFAPPPWVLRKFLQFRPVHGGDKTPCTH